MINRPPVTAFESEAEAYHAFAGESFSWRHVEQPAIDAALGDLYADAGSVLDIGCGNGRVMNHLVSRGVSAENIVGIDPSPLMLHAAKLSVASAQLLEARAEQLPFKDHSFDLVTSSMMLDMIDTQGLNDTLAEVSRVLRPDGHFYFIATNPLQSTNHQTGYWENQATPWGSTIRTYRHNYGWALSETAPGFGLIVQSIAYPVAPTSSQAEDPEQYSRYTVHKRRISALLQKA